MRTTLGNVPIGALCVLKKKVDDQDGNQETRLCFFKRADHPVRDPESVAVFDCGTTQGKIGEPPRYTEDFGFLIPTEYPSQTAVKIIK